MKKIDLENGLNLLKNERIDEYLVNDKALIRRKNLKIKKEIILHSCFYTSRKFYEQNNKDIKLFHKNDFIYILPEKDTIERNILEKIIKKEGIYVGLEYEADNQEIKDILLKNGIGISFGFRENIINKLKSGEFVEIKTNKRLPEYKLKSIEKVNYIEKNLVV